MPAVLRELQLLRLVLVVTHEAGVPRLLFALFAVASMLSSSTLAAEYVVHISVDGLRPSYMQAVIDGGAAPNLQRFQDEGAWTNNARTDYSRTITLPNHTSMLTGRPVLQPAGMPNTVHHGYTDNDDPSATATLHNAGNPNLDYVASVFDVVHDAGLSTALYSSKSKFILYEQSYDNDSGALHANGRDKIDEFFAEQDSSLPYSASMQSRFLSDLAAQHFNYSFVHYSDTDVAGHQSGWGSVQWLQALFAIDGYLGQVFELVESDATLAGQTAIILTTDHGGSGNGHSTASAPENYTIPVFAWGAGVGHGNLYELNNDTRVDPDVSRPSYSGADQPIRNGDTGNLALMLLGLAPVPGSLINLNQDLRVAMPGDYNRDGAVDAADYTVWRDALDQEGIGLAADGNGNHVVDHGDYDQWKIKYQQTDGSGANSGVAIPEPSVAMLLWTGLLGCWFATRRRRRIVFET